MDEQTINSYIDQTVESLKSHNLKEIILFGSACIKNSFNKDSDIDLLVILDTDTIPRNYEEKMALKLELRRSLRHINRKIPIDLLVYTKKEFAAMKEENSSFFREITKTGKKLYEKTG